MKLADPNHTSSDVEEPAVEQCISEYQQSFSTTDQESAILREKLREFEEEKVGGPKFLTEFGLAFSFIGPWS